MKRIALFFIPLAVAASGSGAPPANAGCHLIDCVENVYVKPEELADASCETLWILRNSIFKDAKYCFQSARGASWFGNEGCLYTEQAEVPLNDYQRANADVLKSAEADRGC